MAQATNAVNLKSDFLFKESFRNCLFFFFNIFLFENLVCKSLNYIMQNKGEITIINPQKNSRMLLGNTVI